MMRATPWQSRGERTSPVQKKLSTLIRGALAPIEDYGQPRWENWSHIDPKPDTPLSAVPGLSAISWRLKDKISWQNRDAAVFVFSGQAWIDGDRIDFTGDCVRDLTSGGFFEFELITMGLNSRYE